MEYSSKRDNRRMASLIQSLTGLVGNAVAGSGAVGRFGFNYHANVPGIFNDICVTLVEAWIMRHITSTHFIVVAWHNGASSLL